MISAVMGSALIGAIPANGSGAAWLATGGFSPAHNRGTKMAAARQTASRHDAARCGPGASLRTLTRRSFASFRPQTSGLWLQSANRKTRTGRTGGEVYPRVPIEVNAIDGLRARERSSRGNQDQKRKLGPKAPSRRQRLENWKLRRAF